MNGIKATTFLILTVFLAGEWIRPISAEEREYRFEGRISQTVLENYLSRAVTFAELLNPERTEKSLNGSVEDNIRFLKNVGAKFAGRAIYMWGNETRLPRLLTQAKPIVEMIHQADPDMILQAAAFEIVSSQVNEIPVPSRVFEEFDLKPEKRNFRYKDMLYPDGQGHNHWRNGSSIPDMSQLETRLWFYFLSTGYIDIGIEAIHFGQVEIMDNRDPQHRHWQDMLSRVRKYAAGHARRNIVLCDAHVPSGGIVENGKLLFDFHSFPLRIEEVPNQPGHGILKVGYLDSIYKRSKGGISPSGWTCDHLPYLAEVDNFGSSGRGGQNIGAHWCWGYDEICWFAHQPEEYRNQWLRYAWKWIRRTDPAGFLQMPASRTLADPVGKVRWYYANTRSENVPFGFNQEDTIKSIWEKKYTPTANYETRDIEGWQIKLNNDFSVVYPDLTEEVLNLVKHQLYQITRVVPAGAVAELQKIRIWVEYRNKEVACMCYHPSATWLLEHDYNPAKAKGVEIGHARNFLTWTLDQPWMILHELAHGYHHQVLGYDNKDIKQAYEKAKKSKTYDSVLHINGKPRRHYALNNDQEYFAEATEAFFGTNDFYPFVRSELKKHDPHMYQVLQKLWRK